MVFDVDGSLVCTIHGKYPRGMELFDTTTTSPAVSKRWLVVGPADVVLYISSGKTARKVRQAHVPIFADLPAIDTRDNGRTRNFFVDTLRTRDLPEVLLNRFDSKLPAYARIHVVRL
jgi:hypothetical protein